MYAPGLHSASFNTSYAIGTRLVNWQIDPFVKDAHWPSEINGIASNVACAAPSREAHRSRASVYFCTYGVVEYRASENVTPV